MKTRLQRFLDSRSFLLLTALLYLALAGVLFYVIGTRTKPEIEIILTNLIPKVLQVNFLLITLGIVLCRRDIGRAVRDLFTTKGRVPHPLVPGDAGAGESAAHEAVNEGVHKRMAAPLFTALTTPGVRLLLIVIAGSLLVTLAAPQTHRIYYDEDIYANMGQNIAYAGQAGMANYGTFEYGEYFVNWIIYNKDPAGWPFLISLVFQLFGTDETLAFYLNNLLFAGGILVVFFIAAILTGGSPFPALLAALVYALIPHNLIWANTIAAENAAAVFGGLAVLCALAWLRTRETRRLFLLAAVLPFACAMRPESALIALWVFAAAAINLFAGGGRPADVSADTAGGARAHFRHPFAARGFWAMGLIAFALILPSIWHFYAMSGESWGAEGAKFATAFLAGNLTVNGPFFFDNREFPLLFTLLALIGLAAWRGLRGQDGRRVDFRSVLLMLLWFLLFWGLFLFFYAGSYKYGADVRFALVCFIPLAILAGLGGGVLREWLGGPFPVAGLLVLLLLISWLKFVPMIRTVGQEAWGARYDHKNALEFIREIPTRAIVLTHIPTMFLLWGQNAIQAAAGISNPDLIRDLMNQYNGHVYFHKNYWCNAANDANKTICDEIGQKYDLEPVAVSREQTNEYGLYRMTFK